MIKNIILTNYSKARMYKIIESLNKNYKKLLEQSNEQEKQDYILDWSVIMQKFMSLDTALRCLDIEDLEEIVKKNKV